MKLFFRLTIMLGLLTMFYACDEPKPKNEIKLVPQPVDISILPGSINLNKGFIVDIGSEQLKPIVSILEEEFLLLTGIRNQSITKNRRPTIFLKIEQEMEKEAYSLSIDENINITGGSYEAVSMATASLWQLINDDLTLPNIKISDHPANSYRSIMIDVARSWHDVAVLKEIVNLCKWYKINYLHLHLSDDQSFTFPSEAYPLLSTPQRHYTKQELIALNKYAYERGVILVPEIDVPGHATQFISKMPALFGIENIRENGYTISMGKERVYSALEKIITELSAVFTHSPYIHVGGDEAYFAGMDKDTETIAYMKAKGIVGVKELFRHFINRLNEMVKKQGKQTIIWAGFHPEGKIEIDKDIIVMLWEPIYYNPRQLLKDGFQVINASFKPLYVVNNRKWSAKYIFKEWTPYRWESWTNIQDNFVGNEVAPNENVLGATMCAWEQRQFNEVHRLAERVPAMSDRLWNNHQLTYENFSKRKASTGKALKKLIRPFSIAIAGKTFLEDLEGNFNEHMWFSDTLTITPSLTIDNVELRYSFDDKPIVKTSPLLDGPVEITASTTVKIQAFLHTPDGDYEELGHPFHQRFYLNPITVKSENSLKALPPGSWEKQRFEDQLKIVLNHKFKDAAIRYTLDGTRPSPNSNVFSKSINLDKTTTVKAQLFSKEGKLIGSPFGETYYKLIREESLTTGKPVIASTDGPRPGLANLANNGRITLWEQWDDHANGNNWVQVDLEELKKVNKFKVYNFWDGYRYYQYTIEGSVDGNDWIQLVDFSNNTEKASIEGYSHQVDAREVRYLKINLLYNSANPGLHLVEFNAFE